MITNITTGEVISKNELYCTNSFTHMLGLMFRKKQNLVMIFKNERKMYLHNFFVFYPIDVLVLNKEKEIIEIKKRFQPFTFWNSSKEGIYLIELGFPSNYSVGDHLRFLTK
tara:strand:+ start:885 stop:1217 length:333 start_codon:yes stop_codon:yes gene_type:complete